MISCDSGSVCGDYVLFEIHNQIFEGGIKHGSVCLYNYQNHFIRKSLWEGSVFIYLKLCFM